MAVIDGSGQCWDSGELPSDIRRIVYAGDSLQSWTKYYWKVGYKTKREDRFVCSPLSSFTTGMMSPQEWGDARWISDGHDKDYRPSPYFRKDFVTGLSVVTQLLSVDIVSILPSAYSTRTCIINAGRLRHEALSKNQTAVD